MAHLPVGIVVFIVGVSGAFAGCPVPTKHYTTLGCVPSEELSANDCPRWFNCSALESRTSDKCYLYGQAYELREPVPDAKVKSACLALCTCQKNTRGVAEFHCAHIDCPEFLTPHRAGCVRQYRTNDCCSSRQACGQKRDHLAQCTLDGVRYYEGERMQFSSDPCLTCICAASFNATDPLAQAKCYANDCPFELISPSVLANGAAPVYYGKRCCPWEWRLPQQEDRVNRTNGTIYSDGPMCRYGKLTLNVGEALVPEVTPMGVYKCFCSIPPMVHCFLSTS
uniref:VWFC domain-containing protein n=1 Tax=Anopheles atroparvus TaxID=41427 RepID=A0A182IXB8_ANOAO